MLVKIVRHVHRLIPIPTKIFLPLSLLSAIAGFAYTVDHSPRIALWLFFASGVLGFISLALSNGAYGTQVNYVRRVTFRTVDFFFVFSFLWLEICTPCMCKSTWVAICIFVTSYPMFTFWGYKGRFEPPRLLIRRRIQYLLMLLVAYLALTDKNLAGNALVLLGTVGIISSVQQLMSTLLFFRRVNEEESEDE